MIITKKRFEKIIEQRVERERRITRIEERNRQQSILNRKMTARIRNIENRLDSMEESMGSSKGSIKGFYINKDGNNIPVQTNGRIVPTEEILGDKSTMPSG